MTNREKISELIKINFPNIEIRWEQNGDTIKRDKNGIEIERHPSFGNHLIVTRPNSSKMGSIKWLNDEYKTTDICEWIKYDYRTMCPKNHGDIANPYWRIPINTQHLKYCPYCGMEIHLIEE